MKSIRWFIACCGVAVFGFDAGSICEAQRANTSANRNNNYRRWYQPPRNTRYMPYPYTNYTSNPVEGARYGMADVIRARGEAAETTTGAMINYEQAKSAYIDNTHKWTETYWKRKRLGESEIQKDLDKQRATTDYWRAHRESGAPPRLTPSQLDPTTGKIYWPNTLLDPVFARGRQEIEELFVLRAHTTSEPTLSRQVRTLSIEMQNELRKHIRDMTPNEYTATKRFLDSLAYESQLPAA